MKRIGSRDNAHYKALLKLSQSSRERRKSGHVLLDGMHLIEAYEQSCGVPEEIVVSDGGAARPENARYLESRPAGSRISVLADALFDDLALVDTPSGIMAVVAQPRPASGCDHVADAVLLDGVQDPGNLGSILRSAAAAGFRQILLSEDCAQAWSPKALRAAMGAHFQLDIHENSDLSRFLAAYRGQSAATLPAASSTLYSATLGRPLAWVFGSEGLGVRPQVAAQTSRHLRIPMAAASESLNVAAAAAVCLFETLRQRQAAELSAPPGLD
ncbi:MAG: RNA methyltransferase [Candidatus Accumulibacter meliphilus]|jgi:TrmH family RNA methyltransferase|uniref:RNA methyltransferase n=1 Tax=Candidatus Accumulibacter meliphilus TaxID=2211374 RepID=A0A369XJE0_9PROT|nr:MAG: RNA methyltransferase [Candidatus Accumulibacter meliphilus]